MTNSNTCPGQCTEKKSTGAVPKNSRANANNNARNSDSSQTNAVENELPEAELKMLHRIVIDFMHGTKMLEKIEGLSSIQRQHVHRFAQSYGLKTRSYGKDEERVLTLTRSDVIMPHIQLHGPELEQSIELHKFLSYQMTNILYEIYQCASYNCNSYENAGNSSISGLLGPQLVPPQLGRISHGLQLERRELPIYSERNNFLELLNKEQVLIVNGATGSGKSTQVPQYILERAREQHRAVRIAVTQPRRIAAISLATRISQERGEQLGRTVGYQIRMDNNYSKETMLMLTTSGCLLRVLSMENQFFSRTTHLIIDEVHERNLDTDFLLLAVKIELMQNKKLKLILMSATMDLQALSVYFGNAPIIDVAGRSFDVRIFHLEQILSNTGYQTPSMMENLPANQAETNDKQQLLNAYQISRSSYGNCIDNDLILALVEVLLLRGKQGAVIIYLPGYRDMTSLMECLKFGLYGKSVKILLLHSQVDNNVQNSVFQVYRNVQLKIILSTNIGQTSITIPDLLYVIDIGKAKMKTYHAETDASQLTCTWISKADAQQRAGRAGRVQGGICYRLYPTDQYQKFSDYVVPEIVRRTLEEVCLLAKLAAPQQAIAEFLAFALEPPPSECVVQACQKLQLLGVLGPKESITHLGQIIAELPLDVQLGKCLVYSIYYRCLGSMLMIAGFYSVRDPFVLPTERALRTNQQLLRLSFGESRFSDALGIIKLYEDYTALRHEYRIKKYCERYYLCRQAMDVFVMAVKTLRNSVEQIFYLHSDVNEYNRNANMVRLALTAGLYPKIAYIQPKGLLVSEGDPRVLLSRNSCLPKLRTNERRMRSKWIMYVEKNRNNDNLSCIEHATLVSTLMVALQCGKDCHLEPRQNEDKLTLCLDNWIRIIVNKEHGDQLLKLRELIAIEFERLVCTRKMSANDFIAPELVHDLLNLDADSSGLSFKSAGLKRTSK